jgi:predicted DNA-binding WGR domain protein
MIDISADTDLVLHRIDRDRNMARFYVMSIVPTLFGDTSLVRSGGCIGTRGREKLELFETTDEAAAARSKLAICKHKRGYSDTGIPVGGAASPV